MTYRSADAVLEERHEAVVRELAELASRERELTAECEVAERRTVELEQRLQVSGPGGGARGPTFDRIGVLVAGLCVVGVLVIPAQIYIAGYVRRSPEEAVLPILLLAGPGVLAAIIAWPYRALASYARGVHAGVALALLPVLSIVLGWWWR